ncbi:MAG: hypothetical protein ABIH21_03665 [Patescibacteria group bacterium]
MTEKRYVGRVGTVPQGEDFGFISLSSICLDGGGDHDLDTDNDVFVHQSNCSGELFPGMEVVFSVAPDSKRGGKALSARAVTQIINAEAIPAGEEATPGLVVSTPWTRNGGTASLARLSDSPRHVMHMKAKKVPAEDVAQVDENHPLPSAPRAWDATDAERMTWLRAYLVYLFPMLADFGTDFDPLSEDDTVLDAQVLETMNNLRDMGMEVAAADLADQVGKFKSVRSTFKFLWDKGLVRPDTFIPLRELPDLFMAVPVWYMHLTGEEKTRANQMHDGAGDPSTHPSTVYFCNLLAKKEGPVDFNRRWADTFQMFNRRVRTLDQYKGDTIPPHVARIMREALQHFDKVVIATPYLPEAGHDWNDLSWLKMIDPYVLGFKEDLPTFFVLARFSNTGLFPLYADMVADTINFLRANKDKLANFRDAWWCRDRSGGGSLNKHIPKHELVTNAEELIQAFEHGKLFDWLREEWDLAEAKITAGAPEQNC